MAQAMSQRSGELVRRPFGRSGEKRWFESLAGRLGKSHGFSRVEILQVCLPVGVGGSGGDKGEKKDIFEGDFLAWLTK